MQTPKTIHRLYLIAFEQVRDKARMLGVTLKAIVKVRNYSGKVLRRGTPGTFGYVPKPRMSAKSDRRGCNVAGNSRQRRFAHRHPQHFAPCR